MAKKSISIPKLNRRITTLTVVGTTPLVAQRMSSAVQAKISGAAEKGSISKDRKAARDLSVEADGARYTNVGETEEEQWDGFPAAAFKIAMVQAAAVVGVKSTDLKKMLFIVPEGTAVTGEQLVRLETSQPEAQTNFPRNDKGMRCASPCVVYKKWQCKVRVKHPADIIDADNLLRLMQAAGAYIGVGIGRPFSSKGNGGSNGTFQVAGEVTGEPCRESGTAVVAVTCKNANGKTRYIL